MLINCFWEQFIPAAMVRYHIFPEGRLSTISRLLPKQLPKQVLRSRQGNLFLGQGKYHPASWWQLASLVLDQAHVNVPYKISRLKKDSPDGL
jgi:hypothetical protein